MEEGVSTLSFLHRNIIVFEKGVSFRRRFGLFLRSLKGCLLCSPVLCRTRFSTVLVDTQVWIERVARTYNETERFGCNIALGDAKFGWALQRG